MISESLQQTYRIFESDFYDRFMNTQRRIQRQLPPTPAENTGLRQSRNAGRTDIRKRTGIRRRRRHSFLMKMIAFVLFAGCAWQISGWIRNGIRDMNTPVMPPDSMPYLFQTDDQWANEHYGDGPIRETGCGPTSLAMALTPILGWQPNPVDMAAFAQEFGYYVEGAGTAWTLFTEYPAQFGISAWQSEMDPISLQEQLDLGNLLIFSMGPGDFTTSGHIIAAGQSDEAGYANVHDPNSKQRSRKWALNDLIEQASAVFVLQKP